MKIFKIVMLVLLVTAGVGLIVKTITPHIGQVYPRPSYAGWVQISPGPEGGPAYIYTIHGTIDPKCARAISNANAGGADTTTDDCSDTRMSA